MSQHHTSIARISDTELVVERTFRAPPSVLFDAWTKPELVRRWWGPKSCTTFALCEADVRVGGGYRYVLDLGEHGQSDFSGEYQEIDRPHRLVYTQRLAPFPDAAHVVVTFEDRDGHTHVTSRERYPSKEALDGAIAAGMEHGVHETYEQLDALAASLADAAVT